MVLRRSVCGLWGVVTCWGFLQEECGRLCSVMRRTLSSGANAKALHKLPLTLKWWVVNSKNILSLSVYLLQFQPYFSLNVICQYIIADSIFVCFAISWWITLCYICYLCKIQLLTDANFLYLQLNFLDCVSLSHWCFKGQVYNFSKGQVSD